MNLNNWGWNTSLEDKFTIYKEQGLIPGRIVTESRHIYEVETETGRYKAKVSGHFMYTAINRADYPTIGDWTALRIEGDMAIIEKRLERSSSFSRKRAGIEVEEQVIAANINQIFLVFGLDGGRNFSKGALERFLTRAWDSGAEPVIVLNKCDISTNAEEILLDAETVAVGTPIHITSAVTQQGIEDLKSYLKPGKTIAFTGFSGVGKSALINKLCGKDMMKTGKQREYDLKGKHTTTEKKLFQLSGGGILIDSPGIKELQLWGDEESLSFSFEDITKFS
ncbi:MAG: ribosome small subunit-dependent GTPase A, partial [Deltaproteobacteria bacterium]|nr:ribosome small subunit-dependent GTPase A [Deltaproteobacteria bacterium]